MAEEFEITVRSHRLHAQRFGSPSAPLVIGLHGLSLNMKSFDFIGERIGSDSIQLVALDLRGRGQSEVTAPGSYGWENHALDVFAVADALGFQRFGLVGQSMGGSVAMKAAELDGSRLDAVVLVDAAGRVDRGAGEVAASLAQTFDRTSDSADDYIDAVKALGVIDPWSQHIERCLRYGLEATNGGVKPRTHPDAVAEDRRYGASQHPYDRWKHLTMPTLLVRASREFRPGSGHVVPIDDRDLFLREVPSSSLVDIDANHLTIIAHPDTADALARFFHEARGPL